mgnify:CR=1 FL=1
MRATRMSRIETAVRTALAFIAAHNKNDFSALQALVADSCRLESHFPPPAGTVYTSKAALTDYWQAYQTNYPQAQLTVEDDYGAGNRAVLRWRLVWSPAPGASAQLRGAMICKLREKQLHEIYLYAKG